MEPNILCSRQECNCNFPFFPLFVRAFCQLVISKSLVQFWLCAVPFNLAPWWLAFVTWRPCRVYVPALTVQLTVHLSYSLTWLYLYLFLMMSSFAQCLSIISLRARKWHTLDCTQRLAGEEIFWTTAGNHLQRRNCQFTTLFPLHCVHIFANRLCFIAFLAVIRSQNQKLTILWFYDFKLNLVCCKVVCVQRLNWFRKLYKSLNFV